MAPKIPPNADLEFEIEVRAALAHSSQPAPAPPIQPTPDAQVATTMSCFVKDILEESKSDVTPKDEDYVRVFMTIMGPGAADPSSEPTKSLARVG